MGRLRNRTARFRDADKSPEGLRQFSQVMQATEDGAKRYEVIYCCEFLGFLDDEERRVGCLLHPRQNGGQDYRDVSFYGRELCDGHFCPSYYYISQNEKQALLHILDDWYLYGLVVTDIDLVKTYFKLISEGIYETPPADIFRIDRFQELARGFFQLKLDWPFRSADIHRLGKYYFDGSQYMITFIDYDGLGCERSPYDKIFLSLSSTFRNKDDVSQAEELIRNHIEAFVEAYPSAKRIFVDKDEGVSVS